MWCSNKLLQIRTKTFNSIKKKFFYWQKFDWVWQTYRISRLGNPTLLKVWDVQKWTYCLTGKISMFCSVASITLLAKILNNAKTISQKNIEEHLWPVPSAPKWDSFWSPSLPLSFTWKHLVIYIVPFHRRFRPDARYSNLNLKLFDFLMVLSLKR